MMRWLYSGFIAQNMETYGNFQIMVKEKKMTPLHESKNFKGLQDSQIKKRLKVGWLKKSENIDRLKSQKHSELLK